MIARVADHCFWFGRYVERAESTARLLAATASLALDAELPAAQLWRPVVVVSGEEEAFRARVADGADDHAAWGDGEIVQRFMTWDDGNGVSLVRSLRGARENARSIREVLSHEAWEAINELYLWLPGAEPAYAHHRDGFYQQIRRATQLTLGLLRSTMLHDEPLDFVWLGVLLERVGQTARLLDVHHHAFGGDSVVVERALTSGGGRAGDGEHHEIVDTALWLSLLRALGGSEAFLKRSAGRVGASEVARFLFAEAQFPRSIAYCVHSAHDRLCAIRPPDRHDLPGGQSLERLRVLDAWVAARASEPLAALHELLVHVVDEVNAICGLLATELLA